MDHSLPNGHSKLEQPLNTNHLVLFSFGHRYGLPIQLGLIPNLNGNTNSSTTLTDQAHCIIDARLMVNPPRSLRVANTGLTKSFQQALFADPDRELFYQQTLQTVLHLLRNNNFDIINPFFLAVGCEMGKHRSVAIVERLTEDLSLYLVEQHWTISNLHRDVNRQKTKSPKTAAKH